MSVFFFLARSFELVFLIIRTISFREHRVQRQALEGDKNSTQEQLTEFNERAKAAQDLLDADLKKARDAQAQFEAQLKEVEEKREARKKRREKRCVREYR